MNSLNRAGRDQTGNHLSRELRSVSFDRRVIGLQRQFLADSTSSHLLTLIGSRSRMMLSGTGHLVRFTSRLKDEKFWMGIIPGMIGCVMPLRQYWLIGWSSLVPLSRHVLTHCWNPSTS